MNLPDCIDAATEANPHADCVYWRLTRTQCVHHHVRLTHHYADRARWHAKRARRSADVGAIATLALAATALALVVLG